MKVDLETQLRAYARFLDNSDAEDDGASAETSSAEVVVLGRAPRDRRRWLAIAAAAIALLGVGAAGLAVSRDSVSTPASRPFPPRWQVVQDPAGVFVPPAEEPVPASNGGPGTPDPGSQSPAQNRLVPNAVTSTDTGWVAVGSESRTRLGSIGAVWHSADGLTWTRLAVDAAVFGAFAPATETQSGPGHYIDMSDVAAAGDLIVATGTEWSRSVLTPLVAVSADAGITWRRSSLPTPPGLSTDEIALGEVVSDGGRLVIAGNTNLGGAAIAWASPDGRNWELSAVGSTGQHSQSIGVTDEGFLIGGTDEHHRTVAWFSDDGRRWERTDLYGSTTPPAEQGQFLGFAQSGDVVVAFAQDVTSERGTSIDASGSVNVDGQSQLVAWSSLDGRAWTPVDLGTASADYLFGFRASEGSDTGVIAIVQTFRAHHVHTLMLSSTDGSTWMTHELVGMQSAPLDIAVDDIGTWVAVAVGDPPVEQMFTDSPEAFRAMSTGAIWLGS